MIDVFLVPERTEVTAKGDSPVFDVSGSSTRVFLLTLDITRIIEQESIEIGIFGSPDGATWNPKPVSSFPQEFYCGEYPLLLDLSQHPEAKFVRAHWEVGRWGRGTETPMFEFSLRMKEVPPEILRETRRQVETPA